MVLTDQECWLTARGEGACDVLRCCESKDIYIYILVRGRKDNRLESIVGNKENSEMERAGNLRLIQAVYS